MAKSNRPRPRKPGVGLGQLFSDHEGPTGKLPVIAPKEMERCPKCRGSTMIEYKLLGKNPNEQDMRKFGVYEFRQCDACQDGRMTAEEAVLIRQKMEKEKKKK